MANYASSNLLDAITNINGKLNSMELRPPVDQVIEAFMTQREISVPNLTELRTSSVRATKTNWLHRTTQVVSNARTCTPTAVYGDSGQLTVTWTTYAATVYLSHKRMNNNYYSTMQAFQNDLYNALLDLRAQVTSDMIAYLEANKTTVNDGTLGTWDAVNSVMEYAHADYDNFFNYLITDMNENDYAGPFLNIHSISQRSLMKYPNPSNPGGDGNTQLQYLQNMRYTYDGMDFYKAHITNASDHMMTNYLIPTGGIAVLDWIPALNREGQNIGTKEWGTIAVDPSIIPFDVATYIVRDCADTTSVGGETQDLVDQYELSFDLALVSAPLTNAGETVIFKNALLS